MKVLLKGKVASRKSAKPEQGFTLIELSIVLVIIGLIVGGVLVGQDLIRAAEVRATISQIEKYNTAVNTFRGKYNSIPGDMNAANATTFGFTARGTIAGMGDGNGIIEGTTGTAANGYIQIGEPLAFWTDLSVGNTGSGSAINVNLVDGTFNTYTSPTVASITGGITGSNAASYVPPAKLGRGNSIYVFSTGGVNYFAISSLTTSSTGAITASGTMTAQQAYQMDKKVDDGLPTSGSAQATLITGGPAENAVFGGTGTTATLMSPHVGGANIGAGATSTDCFDSSTSPNYMIGYNNGANVACGMSFRFN